MLSPENPAALLLVRLVLEGMKPNPPRGDHQHTGSLYATQHPPRNASSVAHRCLAFSHKLVGKDMLNSWNTFCALWQACLWLARITGALLYPAEEHTLREIAHHHTAIVAGFDWMYRGAVVHDIRLG